MQRRTVGGLDLIVLLESTATSKPPTPTPTPATPLFETGETVFEQFFVEIARRTAEGSKATLERQWAKVETSKNETKRKEKIKVEPEPERVRVGTT